MLVVSSMVHPARGLKSAAFGVAGSAFSSVVVPVVTPGINKNVFGKQKDFC
jgi:hypothetical protein